MSLAEKTKLFANFGLEYSDPSEFDYEKFTGNWCRFCGARYSPQFFDSLLGSNTFCEKHFKDLENGNIEIRKMRGRKGPLKPGAYREITYMKKQLKLQKNSK